MERLQDSSIELFVFSNSTIVGHRPSRRPYKNVYDVSQVGSIQYRLNSGSKFIFHSCQ